MTDLNSKAKEIHAINVSNGFYENRNLEGFEEHQLFEIIKELGEMSEAHKKDNRVNLIEFEQLLANENHFKFVFEMHVKDTFEDELADTYIRCLDKAGSDVLNIEGVEMSCDFAESNQYSLSKYIFGITRDVHKFFERNRQEDREYYMMKIICQLFAIADLFNIDLAKHIELKLKYNSMRGKLHGKAY